MRNKKIKLHNGGTPVRSWIHAKDTADAVMFVLENGKVNQKYNISAGFEQSNISTVKKIINCFFGFEANHENFVDYSYQRDGQDVRYSLDCSKLYKLGWKPKVSFDEEIDSIVKYYKKEYSW